jgi:hypothetical protein
VLNDLRNVRSSRFFRHKFLIDELDDVFIDELDDGLGIGGTGAGVGRVRAAGSGHVAERLLFFLCPVHERLILGMRNECERCGGGGGGGATVG